MTDFYETYYYFTGWQLTFLLTFEDEARLNVI
jgi:hypothetical protein